MVPKKQSSLARINSQLLLSDESSKELPVLLLLGLGARKGSSFGKLLTRKPFLKAGCGCIGIIWHFATHVSLPIVEFAPAGTLGHNGTPGRGVSLCLSLLSICRAIDHINVSAPLAIRCPVNPMVVNPCGKWATFFLGRLR